MVDKTEQLEVLETKLRENGAGKLYGPDGDITFARGNPGAELLLLSQSPPEDADWDLLQKILTKLEVQAYCANLVKKVPPKGRAPKLEEVQAHAPYLWAELAVIQPKVIVTLGPVATSFLTVTEGPMGTLRGMRRLKYQDEKHGLEIPVVATWNPSYALHKLPDKGVLREMALDIKRATIMMAKAE